MVIYEIRSRKMKVCTQATTDRCNERRNINKGNDDDDDDDDDGDDDNNNNNNSEEWRHLGCYTVWLL
jgi:hypothetical protein